MQRCFQLASLGAGSVAPNPMVGAVLVYQNRIIGEGYHQAFGQPHAEVNCINSVAAADRELISAATLYVSLEPCAHYGKTPPCADLVISKRIPVVVIGCRDSYKEVSGKGIEKLKAAGIQVITGVLEKEALALNKRFFTFHGKLRPYIILKWAQTADHFIGHRDGSRLLISNTVTNRLVHRWRSEEASILVGAGTAIHDNPSLTTRHWKGNNPLRLVIDKHLDIPSTHHLLDGSGRTIVFNAVKEAEGPVRYHRVEDGGNYLPEILTFLHQLNIQSVLVEGGRSLLSSMIEMNCWDEARVITNQNLVVGSGVPAPVLTGYHQQERIGLGSDIIQYNTLQEPF
jgi:diaminohydroxyphosphoribosylaminopyrimidine deaminase/5-amino-6-(5-phosphoribosylamino)uracil reductase